MLAATASPSMPAHARTAPSDRTAGALAVAVFMAAICWSPLIPGLLHLNSSLAFIAAFLLFSAITVARVGLDTAVACTSLALVLACLLLFLATGSPTLLARVAPLPMLLFASYQAVSLRPLVDRLCDALSAFMAIGIVMCIVGFAYAYAGGQPILSIENTDGRENALYLTTMSNFVFGSVIRPSFIYDEAGAFSFMICAVVVQREMLGRGARLSWFLMVGGLITLSLTHTLILLLFMARRLGIATTAAIVALLAVAGATAVQSNDDLSFFADRFEVQDGKLAGDNRSNQVQNFFAVVNPEIVLFGDVECHKRPERTCDEHGDISSSPVTPTYRAGVLMLGVQLLVHAALLVAFLRRREFRFPALALTLLLLQRPYFEGYGYGFMTYVALFQMFQPGMRRPRSVAGRPVPAASAP
jgi:hypothetical protein